jgi:predicted transcriptional regulator
MFKLIKESPKDREGLRDELRISRKQFYDRTQKLIDTGLIKRKSRYYSVTSFGHLVYEAQAKVSKALENRSALEIVDVLIRSDIPKDQYAKFVDRLIHDLDLREVIAKRMGAGP